ncbi:DUF722 domain-containing protein [Carnobacterium antarcticum]|nr:DUF722 domain-containing protein [Carnobacterium sp. CP1]
MDYPKMDEYIMHRRLELKYPIGQEDENIGGSSSGNISNPTERTVMTIHSDKRLTQLEKTKDAIEKVLDTLDTNAYALVELRYWTKPQTRTWVGVAKEIGYSERQCYNVRDLIIENIGKELGMA